MKPHTLAKGQLITLSRKFKNANLTALIVTDADLVKYNVVSKVTQLLDDAVGLRHL